MADNKEKEVLNLSDEERINALRKKYLKADIT